MTCSHRRRPPEQIAKILADYERSGLTQKAFAQKHTIPIATFTYWLRKAREQQAEPTFLTVKQPGLPPNDLAVEVISPNGWTLRLLSPDSRVIQTLLPLIAQQPCSH